MPEQKSQNAKKCEAWSKKGQGRDGGRKYHNKGRKFDWRHKEKSKGFRS